MRSLLLVPVLVMVAWPRTVLPQTTSEDIRVAIAATDPSGRLASVVRSTLRQLSGITVVESSEVHDLEVGLNAICHPDCANATLYAVTFSLRRSIESSRAFMALFALLAQNPDSVESRVFRDTLLIKAIAAPWVSRGWEESMRGYYKTISSSVALWGIERYEEEIRGALREWDTKCFERLRLWNRLMAEIRAAQAEGREGPPDQWQRMSAASEGRSDRWIC